MSLYSGLLDVLLAHGKGGRLLAAGYPDIVMSTAFLESRLGRSDFARDQFSDTIIVNVHNIPDLVDLDYIRDAREVLAAAGYSLDVIDIHVDRGCERIVDLNHAADLGKYDVVLDPGTIEHCFNVGTAALNLANAVDLCGIIIHALPMNNYNHGFYNFCPTWFYDFYSAKSGFKIEFLQAHCGSGETIMLQERANFFALPENTEVICVARRMEMKPLAFAIQGIYDE